MAKSKDRRIDTFRDEALGFVSGHFSDMETVFGAFMKDKQYDKAMALYMKMADKVIPALATQQADASSGSEKPEWQVKVERAKKTMESNL